MLNKMQRPSTTLFSGKVKLITSSQLQGFMDNLRLESIAGHPWTVANGVKKAENAATSEAADCLIIGGQTPLWKNLYHIEPKDIDPKKIARQIGSELDQLSQDAGQGLDVLITGGDFGSPERHNTWSKPTSSKVTITNTPRWEIGKALFEELGNIITKGSYTNKLSILAGRTSGNRRHTGLAMRQGDTDWYLNVIRGSNSRVTPGILSPEAVKRVFESIRL